MAILPHVSVAFNVATIFATGVVVFASSVVAVVVAPSVAPC
jgi:hypothetical protein